MTVAASWLVVGGVIIVAACLGIAYWIGSEQWHDWQNGRPGDDE
jgi:hypothetical protein